MKPLPYYLHETLHSVAAGSGDDIEFVLGHLGSNASSYVSKLKRRGFAYTYRFRAASMGAARRSGQTGVSWGESPIDPPLNLW